MKRKYILLAALLFITNYKLLIASEIKDDPCFICRDNVVFGSYSTALGFNNIINGDLSFLAGNYSSIYASNSFGLGNYIGINAPFSFTIGKGIDEDNLLINNVENSLMIGFNSIVPSIFVAPALDGQPNNAGFVGIGTASPKTMLDVNGRASFHGLSSAAIVVDKNGISGPYLDFNTNGQLRLTIFRDGNVGIGTYDTKGYKLAVAGKVIAEEVVVKLHSTWPDYVFLPNYDLRTLSQVEDYINSYGHLPEIPSAEQISETGIGVGELNTLLLKKIEELTLYMISQQKEIDKLKQLINNVIIE